MMAQSVVCVAICTSFSISYLRHEKLIWRYALLAKDLNLSVNSILSLRCLVFTGYSSHKLRLNPCSNLRQFYDVPLCTRIA